MICFETLKQQADAWNAEHPQKNFERKPLSPGKYTAKIYKAEAKVSKAGKEYVSVTYEILDDIPKDESKFIFDMLWDPEKTWQANKLLNFLIALGLQKIEFESVIDLIVLIEGKTLKIKTKIEEGKDGYPDKAVVDIFNPEGYTAIEEPEAPIDEDELPFTVGESEPKPEPKKDEEGWNY